MKTQRLAFSFLALFMFACDANTESQTQLGALGEGETCQTDADCGGGLECELEHGESFCKPHGGGNDDGASDDDAGTGSGTCTSDADCAAGQECEFEHGTSFCKPHGG